MASAEHAAKGRAVNARIGRTDFAQIRSNPSSQASASNGRLVYIIYFYNKLFRVHKNSPTYKNIAVSGVYTRTSNNLGQGKMSGYTVQQ
jgi:hypothetical protein